MRFFPAVLLVAYVVLFVALGIDPHDRAVWWAENIPIVAITGILVGLYMRGLRLSNTAYALMSVLLFLHTIGGHFTFERVPFDWFNDAFGWKRNQYDRVAHFSVGFYAYGIAEALERRERVSGRVIASVFGVFAIGTVAAVYEIIEWIYAAVAGGNAGAAFLGSQGDIWDAQKDMLADIAGAITVAVAYIIVAPVRRDRATHARAAHA
ncbi:MAG: DUF2238 domain-containing protein [Polyangiales bacterium]